MNAENMTQKKVKVGDIIQLNENAPTEWIACVMIVSKIKEEGVLAYTKVPYRGDTYLRVFFGHFEIVGRAFLIHPEDAIDNVLNDKN